MLSSSSVSGKNTSPPSSFRLDFFRFSLNDNSFFPFFDFGETGKPSSPMVALPPGLRGPGTAGKVPGLSVGLVVSPSLGGPDRLNSLFSFSGDLTLNKLFSFNVLDLLIVSVTCGKENKTTTWVVLLINAGGVIHQANLQIGLPRGRTCPHSSRAHHVRERPTPAVATHPTVTSLFRLLTFETKCLHVFKEYLFEHRSVNCWHGVSLEAVLKAYVILVANPSI